MRLPVRFAVCTVAACAPTTASSPAATPAAPSPATAAVAPATAASTTAAASDPALAPLGGLLGSWEGSDPARQSSGRFSLAPELGGKVLVRRSSNDSPQGHHEDLMIVFAAPSGLRASYFDNEGHIIQYAITATADRIELVSDAVPQQPRFRLRYELHGSDELAIDFAIAMPGSPEFRHYTGGTVHRAR